MGGREPKPASKGILIEADFIEKEMTGPILVSGPTNTDTLWELEPILELTHSLIVQLAYLLKSVKSPNYLRGRRQLYPPSGSLLDDNPVSSSLDLTSAILLVSPSNQVRD